MLAVPSLNPIRLRGVSWLRLVLEVRPKPSWDQRIATVPRPIRARLRTAWKATWGSSAQACTQRSPPLSSAFSSSAGSGGIWRSAAGRLAARPRPRLSNRPGPKPKVTVRLEGSRPTALAGVVGRRQQLVVDVADHLAGAHFRRRPGPLAHQLAQLGAVLGQQVEGGEVEAVLGRGVDPGLVLAVEGDPAGAVAARLGGVLADQVAAGAEADAGGADAGGGQQPAAGDRGHRRLGRGFKPGSRRGRLAAGADAAATAAELVRPEDVERHRHRVEQVDERLDHGRRRLQAQHPGQQRAGDRPRLDQPGEIDRLALEAVDPARLVGGVGGGRQQAGGDEDEDQAGDAEEAWVRLMRTPPR